MKAWHFANTTVRSPFRLREGLIAIKSCHLEGNIRGSEGDLSLRNCLGNVGLVKLGEDNDFKVLLASKKEKPHELLDLLKTLLIQCREETKQSAPEWKAFIAESFRQTAQKSTSLLGR